MRIKTIIILVLVTGAFGAGVYFKDDVVKFYSGLNKRVQDFQKTDIGQTISQVGRQIFTSSPLNVGGLGNNVTLLKSKIITETNLQRKQNGNPSTGLRTGLPALKENAKLAQAASAKANDMFLNQYFEHVSPSGVGPGTLAQNYGYDYIIEGENLILGNFSSEKEVVQDWMNSPGHRANILNNRYTEIGVAVVKGIYKGETMWIGVQEFGLPLSVCSEPDKNLKNQIDSYKAQLDALSASIDEKRNQINNTNPKSASYNQMINDYNQLITQYDLMTQQIKTTISKYNVQVSNFNNCVTGK
ncbi:MAG: CAP domain-containing protein [Candidatus Staskawiczbacteria bacterium]|nr:CAP domain-containing protein [Candidatus Staskawiczbacteria bacterium]